MSVLRLIVITITTMRKPEKYSGSALSTLCTDAGRGDFSKGLSGSCAVDCIAVGEVFSIAPSEQKSIPGDKVEGNDLKCVV